MTDCMHEERQQQKPKKCPTTFKNPIKIKLQSSNTDIQKETRKQIKCKDIKQTQILIMK